MKPDELGGATSSAAELQRLLERVAVERDRAAFSTLFVRLAPRVKGFLMRSGLDGAAAEEMTQETMLAVWRKASYFDPDVASASTWVFTIARNLRIDRLRRDRTRSFHAAPQVGCEIDAPPSGETAMIAAERDRRVRAAMAALSQEQARIVRLSFFSEKPHSEIARELNIPLGTVKSRTRLALRRLRDLLEGEA